MRDVKIQCTIGPACNDPEILKEMIEAGMAVARVNLSHGSAASQEDKLINFRRAARMQNRDDAAIMFDIRGPEIRVKEIPGERIFAALYRALASGSAHSLSLRQRLILSSSVRSGSCMVAPKSQAWPFLHGSDMYLKLKTEKQT